MTTKLEAAATAFREAIEAEEANDAAAKRIDEQIECLARERTALRALGNELRTASYKAQSALWVEARKR